MQRTIISRGGEQLVISLACIVAVLSLGRLPVEAQDRQSARVPASDLGKQNQGRVAASSDDIKACLRKDPGLIVELKRWIARDATDHGQIVNDTDLTDEAIFDRLDEDVPFRSVATALLQRYGYLLPKLNPESELGKEQEMEIQERAKWRARDVEERLALARQRTSQNMQESRACNPQVDLNCTAPAPGTRTQSPNSPRESARPSEHAQTTQPTEVSIDFETQLPSDGPYEHAQSSNNINLSNPDAVGAGLEGTDTSSSLGIPTAPAGPATRTVSGNTSDETIRAANAAASPDTDRGARFEPGLPASKGIQPTRTASAQPRAPVEPPELVRKRNPYDDIPSLYDMYIQAAPRPAAPRRFGADVFENGTRDSQLIPMDLPVGADYVVGPGDGLAIDLWGGVSRRFYRVVDREGRVSLPEVGPLLVSGKSLADVQQNLQQVLRTQFRDVSADVSLARLRTIRVYEVGDVTNPGAYDISSLSTPLNALFAAGGPTKRGSLRILKHYRGNQLVQIVDVYDLLLHGVREGIQRLENGDTVLVPPLGPQVTIEGMVRRPAIYELRDEKNLARALELAGGLLPIATLRHIEVQRVVAHEKQTMLSVNIPETLDVSEVGAQLESFEIEDGDQIRIYPIAPYNQDVVYLEGHVVRPGKYSYRTEMRVTDVISSYKDLLPEPATQYAEIIRLNAPDFRPSVESFDLAKSLADPSQAPVLHAMDTVRIFSRYDFEDPPKVSVGGDVRMPGTYRTSGQIRLSDAVRLAGGLAPDAQTEDAQVFRYLPDGKVKIFSVSLSQALAGNPVENILLQPRDRLLIHRSPDAVEPATVYLKGEVARPGRYPLTTNMHVADLIRVGGGLKLSADTQVADLTTYQGGNQTQLTGQHEAIAISSALGDDPKSDVPLHNGDVLTIRQVPGWNDLGATIVVKGEAKHPGTYGIRPGERLSSILERAGGFQTEAYPYGAILQRPQVRELESKVQSEMIMRVRSAQNNLALLPDTDPRQKVAKEMALQQWQASLDKLSNSPPTGRVAIRISSNLEHWRNTAADIEVRAGDTLFIPKKPNFVMVTGQVFNPTAVSYRPGKSAKWYLSQSGGPTQLANKKAIFVIRADGSVIGSRDSTWSGNSLGAILQSGDTVVVPEKALSGGVKWQNIFLAAQVATSIVSTAFIAAHY
ncbi:MAG: SLBB domain-containing protein [Candidatus Acidiferrales bacterium]